MYNRPNVHITLFNPVNILLENVRDFKSVKIRDFLKIV